MKITIYELLGLIKDGNQPKKIKHRNVIYTWGYDCYTTAPESTPDVQSGCSIFARYRTDYILNDEVEIMKYNIEIPKVYEHICRTGCMGCPYGSYKHDTEKELKLINEKQLKFVSEYFKESYDVLDIKYKEIIGGKE